MICKSHGCGLWALTLSGYCGPHTYHPEMRREAPRVLPMWSRNPPTAPGWYWIALTVPGGSPALTVGQHPGPLDELREFAARGHIEILHWPIPIVQPEPPEPFLCDECHGRDHVVTDCPIVVRRSGGAS